MDAEQARRVGGGLLPLLDERHNFLLLVGLELRRPAADPAFLARGVEARLGPFLEHRALELGERADCIIIRPAGVVVSSGRKLGRPKGSLGVSRLDGKEDEIRRFLELGVSKTAIAKLTGVSRTALYSFMTTRGLRPSR